jgi:hypothetical protein
MNTSLRWGLALSMLLGLLDIVGLVGLGTDNGPPAVVAIGAAVLGVITIVAAAFVRRRGALATVIVSRVLSGLLAVPVYWADNAPGWAKIVVGIALALTMVAIALLVTGRRTPRST